jgi:hypothetical protein
MKHLALITTILMGTGCMMEPMDDDSQYVDDQGASELVQADEGITVIELTKEEAETLEVNNGGTLDENIAGGTIVLNNVLTEDEKAEYKANLLDPQSEVVLGKGDVRSKWCTGYYLSNVQYQGNSWYFGSQRIGASSGWGPITLSVSVSTSVSATFSANVGVSAEVVSAGVGYSVTASYGVSSSGTWAVPSGTYGTLEAYALHNKHTWDVWNDDCGDPADTYSGNGQSYKPNGGVYFKKVY